MIINHEKIDFGANPLIEKVKIKPPFRLSLNFPNDACFIFFNSGSTKINAPYERKVLNKGDAVLLRCGTYFTELLPTLEQEVYDILVFHLPREIIRQVYSEHFPVSSKSNRETFIHQVDASQILHEFIKGLQVYFDNPALVTEQLLRLKIQELIHLLLKTRNIDTLNELFSDAFSPVEVSMKQVVYSHIFTDCSVSDLAMLCNMSPSTFKRQFSKVFNDTPSNFLKNKRLEKAKELLQHNHLSIGEIAFETCFYDTAHFTRSFRKKFGYSPTEYRKAL